MFKFNGGAGAIICDSCRRIIKEPAGTDDVVGYKNAHQVDLCDFDCLKSYESTPHCKDCGVETVRGPGCTRCDECWAMRIPGL